MADVLAFWSCVEADFQREYQLNLVTEMQSGLSYRRFMALLQGLSHRSVFIQSIIRTYPEIANPKQEVISDVHAIAAHIRQHRRG